MEAITPIDELEAVNILLSMIDETPINTLEGVNNADVAVAQGVLREVNREVQAQGWHFNREHKVPFARNLEGKIPIPSNVARWDVTNSNYDVIQRGGFAYNKTDRTFIFDKNLEATVVYYLPFDELTESARIYIATKAGRRFTARKISSKLLWQFTEGDEYQARASFLDENEEVADRSLITSEPLRSILDRPYRRTC